jgi:hypothetical protein
MDRNQYYQEHQEAKQLHDRLSSLMENFKGGSPTGGRGIRKLRGAKPLAVSVALSSLPFGGVNFSRASSITISEGFCLRIPQESLGVTCRRVGKRAHCCPTVFAS